MRFRAEQMGRKQDQIGRNPLLHYENKEIHIDFIPMLDWKSDWTVGWMTSVGLSIYASILQTEVYAIDEYANENLKRNLRNLDNVHTSR